MFLGDIHSHFSAIGLVQHMQNSWTKDSLLAYQPTWPQVGLDEYIWKDEVSRHPNQRVWPYIVHEKEGLTVFLSRL